MAGFVRLWDLSVRNRTVEGGPRLGSNCEAPCSEFGTDYRLLRRVQQPHRSVESIRAVLMNRSTKIYSCLWCVWLVCVVIVVSLNAGMVNPADNTHSSFLKNYSPTGTTRRFAANYGRREIDGGSADAGRGFVHNSRI